MLADSAHTPIESADSRNCLWTVSIGGRYMTVDELTLIEADAISQASKATDPETRLKWIMIANAVQERRKSEAETSNSKLAAQNTAADLHHQRMKFFIATFTPALSTLIAILALVFQGQQFNKSIKLQTAQSLSSNITQVQASDNSRWQESMKSVSFKDPQSALTGALSMQVFFNDRPYAWQSRAVASSLLPLVNNVMVLRRYCRLCTDLRSPGTINSRSPM